MPDNEPSFWRIHCHTATYPGQWLYWFRNQCCAVGWPPPAFSLDRHEPEHRDWTTTQNAFKTMRPGDWVVATLPGNRVGRIGQIFELRVCDDQWDPVIRARPKLPSGENGRRILVRWDLDSGPQDPGKVVRLPPAARLNSGQRRGTVRHLRLSQLAVIRAAMQDPANWCMLASSFALETALSDYIAVHPHRLESGLIAHPELNVRELTFQDGRRADVILQDRSGRVVVVECKQNAATAAALRQVDHYRRKLAGHNIVADKDIRALVVHGGSSRLSPEVRRAAAELDVELVYYELQVNFFGTSLRAL